MRFEECKKYLPHAGIAAVAFGVGLGVGWHLANWKRSLRPKTYQFVAIEPVEEPEKDNGQMSLEFDTPRGDTIVIDDIPAEPMVIVEEVTAEEDDEDNLVSIFRNVEDDVWSYELEEKFNRQGEDPYTLHRDEYFANETDWAQCTVTYYAGDDVLCDTDDVPVYDYRKIVGDLLFGHGSLDPNIVYVRNPKIEVEYEVLRDPGFYSREILGAEIEHSFDKRKPPIPKFIKE